MGIIQTDTTEEVSDCFLESMSLTTNCSNTWNLSPKSFVMLHTMRHLSSLDAHFERFAILYYGLRAISEVSGYGEIPGISDANGNSLSSDGGIRKGICRPPSYAVVSERPFHNFEGYASSLYDILDEIADEADAKEDALTLGNNLSFDFSNPIPAIDKKDTVYELRHATSSMQGGVTIDADAISEDSSSAATASAIHRALSRKSEILFPNPEHFTKTVTDTIPPSTVISLNCCGVSADSWSPLMASAFVEGLSRKSGTLQPTSDAFTIYASSLDGHNVTVISSTGVTCPAGHATESELGFVKQSVDGTLITSSADYVLRYSEIYEATESQKSSMWMYDSQELDIREMQSPMEIVPVYGEVAASNERLVAGSSIYEKLLNYQDAITFDDENFDIVQDDLAAAAVGHTVSSVSLKVDSYPSEDSRRQTLGSGVYSAFDREKYLEIDETYENGFRGDCRPMRQNTVFLNLRSHSIFNGRNGLDSLVLSVPASSKGASRDFSVFRTVEPSSIDATERDWFFANPQCGYSFTQSAHAVDMPPNGKWSFIRCVNGTFFASDRSSMLYSYSEPQRMWAAADVESAPINGMAYGESGNGDRYYVASTSKDGNPLYYVKNGDPTSNSATWTAFTSSGISCNGVCFDETSRHFLVALSNGLYATDNMVDIVRIGTESGPWSSVYSDGECVVASRSGHGIYCFAKTPSTASIGSYAMERTDIDVGTVHRICGGNGNYIALGENGEIYGCRPSSGPTRFCHWFEEYVCSFDGQQDYTFEGSDACFFNGRFYVYLTYLQSANIPSEGKPKYYVEVIRSEDDETIEISDGGAVGRILRDDIYALVGDKIDVLLKQGHSITDSDVEQLGLYGIDSVRVVGWRVIHRFHGEIDGRKESYLKNLYTFSVDGGDSNRFPCMPIAMDAGEKGVMISAAYTFDGDDTQSTILNGSMDSLCGVYNSDGNGSPYDFSSHIGKTSEYQYFLYSFRELWDGSFNAERRRIYKLNPSRDAVVGNIVSKTVKRFDDDGLANVESYGFSYCGDLKYVCVNGATSIGDAAFAHCSSLGCVHADRVESVGLCSFIGAGNGDCGKIWLGKCSSIGASAFMDASIGSLYIPNATTIGEDAFSGFSGNIYMPYTHVTSISSSVGFPWGAGHSVSFYGMDGMCLSLEKTSHAWNVANIPSME